MVIPIFRTSVDWQTLTSLASQELRRPVAGSVDRAKLSPKSPVALISVLESIARGVNSSIEDRVRFAIPSTLDHLHFGFLITERENVLNQIMALTSRSLSLTLNGHLAIISGTLKEWRSVVVLGLSHNVSEEVRIIFGEIFFYFEGVGLRDLWSEYSKKSVEDRSFILE